ncbi:MAG: adenylate kinase [Lachnospiraceae bacterium]|nr:adenylate kinase [Lachnospiraceae bacterium]
MKKIIILGCPGSGKSTFAVELQRYTGLPLVHLDKIWWKPNKTHITRSEFDEKLDAVLHTDAWIIDGDYSRTYEVRMKACDTVFFLDYSEETCMAGIRARVGQERKELPWVENELAPDLVEEVHRYREQNRLAVLELFEKYPDKEIHIFHNRKEAEQWLTAQKREICRRI